MKVASALAIAVAALLTISCSGGQEEEEATAALQPPSTAVATPTSSSEGQQTPAATPSSSTPGVPAVVGPEAVWFPAQEDVDAGRPCYEDQACIARFMQQRGASTAALRFFLQHNAFLCRLWDFGTVDLALTRWPWWVDIAGYRWLLVNGTPEVDPALLLPADLGDPPSAALGPYATEEVREGYASIAEVIGVSPWGPQWNTGVVESALSRPDGGQSFILEYTIGECPNCDSGYRFRVQLNFSSGGVFERPGSVLPPCSTEPGGNMGKRIPGLAPACPSPLLVPWEHVGSRPLGTVYVTPPATSTPTPEPTPSFGVPVCSGCKSYAPYRLIPMYPGHDQEMQVVLDAAQTWERLAGANLFDDTSPSTVAVMFQDDPECASNQVAAAFPGTAASPYAAFVWLCIKQFQDDKCSSAAHELGHVLGLADNHTPGSTGVMSAWMGHYPGDGGLSYEEWCHNPATFDEAFAVKLFNSTH